MTALGWARLAVGGAAAAGAVVRDARALAELCRRIPLIHRQLRLQLRHREEIQQQLDQPDRAGRDGARERDT